MQYILLTIFFFSSLFWHPAFSNEESIQLKLTVFEEITFQDKHQKIVTKLIAPTNVTPNDTVVYITEYQNNSAQEARNVKITVPIPQHLIYISNSATKPSASESILVHFSVDQGQRFDTLNRLTVTDATGKKHPANPENYTHIRWVIPSIAAESIGFVQFKAKLK